MQKKLRVSSEVPLVPEGHVTALGPVRGQAQSADWGQRAHSLKWQQTQRRTEPRARGRGAQKGVAVPRAGWGQGPGDPVPKRGGDRGHKPSAQSRAEMEPGA